MPSLEVRVPPPPRPDWPLADFIIFSLNILLRVFSTPVPERIVVKGGIAFFRPPLATGIAWYPSAWRNCVQCNRGGGR